MGQNLLVNEQIEAGEKFAGEFNDYAPVSVYFWLNPAESDRLYLYIASDAIDDTNFDAGYGEVLRKVGKLNQWLDPFQIKLVNASDSVAKAAFQIRERFPGSLSGTHYRGALLGDVGIDYAYIYPQLTKANAIP
ncbi:MAG: hypothetical protein SH868_19560 [Bythopirellula sp.]|nr:hypothetical protein [Bythopirellula sp.]